MLYIGANIFNQLKKDMKIKLDQEIIANYPGLNVIVMLIKNINNQKKVSSLTQLLSGTAVVAKNMLKKPEQKNLFERVSEPDVGEGKTFLESYLLAARMKKIQNGKPLDGPNNLLNLVNLLSLKYFLPLHGFDLDQAEKDYIIEFYQSKKGKKAPELDFIAGTKNLAIWFPNLAGYADEEIDQMIGEINANFNKYLFGQIAEVYHLNAEMMEVDLGYVSEKENEYLNRPKVELADEVEEIVTVKNSEISNSKPAQLSVPQTVLNLPEKGGLTLEIKPILGKFLSEVLLEIYPEMEVKADYVDVEMPKDLNHGDYASSIGMKLVKIVNESPQIIAQKIKSKLEEKAELMDLIDSIEVVGPGFINFKVKKSYFIDQVEQILTYGDQFGKKNVGEGQKVMIEFGSLNMAKPFGAHHFMTTVIGQTLVNIYKNLGYQVVAADFPGDWGTQFGKTIYAFKEWGDKAVIEQDPMNELLKLYVKFHNVAEEKPELEDMARAEFKKLEEGDAENLELWKWIVEVTNKDVNEIYQTMGVKHDLVFPESKYNTTFQDLLEKGKQLGVIVEGEKGAWVVNFEEEKLSTAVIQKADGTSLYITRDLASIKDRLTMLPDLKKMVYVVDSAQSLHFQQLFALAKKMHALDQSFPISEFKHVVYGRMSFADSAMSTRKGNIILAREIIKEALVRAEKIVEEKNIQNIGNGLPSLTDSEKRLNAQGIAIGAIKYAMLAQAPESDMVFDWDKVLSFEGNSAPYLQYTEARAKNILRKYADLPKTEAMIKKIALKKMEKVEDQTSLFSLEEDKKDLSIEEKMAEEMAKLAEQEKDLEVYGLNAEVDLLKKLYLFPEKLAKAAEEFKPNLLTGYLHDLAQSFNSFYTAVPVLKCSRSDLLESRIKLVKATAQVLKNGLDILDIVSFERM